MRRVANAAAAATSPSLASKAYEKIRNRILKGEIALGESISRRSIAAQLGMSFVPVTEAMQRLEAEGMLESLPRIGTRVRVPTATDVRDRYIIREALEVQSARLFSERASAAERKELTAMARKLDQMAREDWESDENQFAFQSLHVRFHMRIAECTGCQPLYDLLEKNQVLIFNWLFDVAADSHMPAEWHGDLMAVVGGSDPEAAALAMGVHIRSGMTEIQNAITERFSTTLSWMQRRNAPSKKSSDLVTAARTST